MKVLTITCKSTDEDDEFQTELEIIIKALSEGFESGFDRNDSNSFKYDSTYTWAHETEAIDIAAH